VEVVDRVAPDRTRYLFVLNHGRTTRTVPSPVDGTDLLTDRAVHAGAGVVLDPAAVLVVRCQG
jgi:beta-galactosidase